MPELFFVNYPFKSLLNLHGYWKNTKLQFFQVYRENSSKK